MIIQKKETKEYLTVYGMIFSKDNEKDLSVGYYAVDTLPDEPFTADWKDYDIFDERLSKYWVAKSVLSGNGERFFRVAFLEWFNIENFHWNIDSPSGAPSEEKKIYEV